MKNKILIALMLAMVICVGAFFFIAYSKNDNNNIVVKAAVDRFEDDCAVILMGEEEIPVNIPKKFIPKNAKPGESWLIISIELDFETEQEQWQSIRNLLSKIKR